MARYKKRCRLHSESRSNGCGTTTNAGRENTNLLVASTGNESEAMQSGTRPINQYGNGYLKYTVRVIVGEVQSRPTIYPCDLDNYTETAVAIDGAVGVNERWILIVKIIYL